MRTKNPVAILRSDYQPPNWHIEHTDLHFQLDVSATVVTNTMRLQRQAEGPLQLDGVDLQLESIALDGSELAAHTYRTTSEHLVLEDLPDSCSVTIVTRVYPDANTALEGLYRSSGNFCTQCEAQGFRKITYFLDRPDILSTYQVSIEADPASYPVLLSNGNIKNTQSLESGLQRVTWHDPFPKPCYLFALVAGDLAYVEDVFVTASGRRVALFIYVQAHNLDKCAYAMGALKRSMRWDEDVFNLEYDLDRFMIVAVDDFNMGAMENKGLNIFNSKFVLADIDTATDTDFLGVEAVIAHEYFHNWTGNRVTCRDWFQLSLKEGLTVFRDQQFTSDMHSHSVKRIEDVRLLRARQFPEDAGPMAHPVRPDSFIEINNFYTLTVYEKGAEIIRMMHTLLGAVAFRRGIDLYFERHDGQAVCCDDFVCAMQDSSGVDLTLFKRWYSLAGTPTLNVSDHYDAKTQQYTLTVIQHCPDTPGQSDKPPMHIPLQVGLLGAEGQSLLTERHAAAHAALAPQHSQEINSIVLNVTQREQVFTFERLADCPVPSLLRGFSAPVRLSYAYDDETLAFLMARDDDPFNRWEAGQRLGHRVIERCLGSSVPVGNAYLTAFGLILEDSRLDLSLKAEALTLPSLDTVADAQTVIDIHAVNQAREQVRAALAENYMDALTQLVTQTRKPRRETLGAAAMGERKLANTALTLLRAGDQQHWQMLASEQYKEATNMTDRITALGLLCHVPGELRDEFLDDFYRRWQDQRLVIDKWFAVQAMAQHPGVVDDVLALAKHPAFDRANPNRLRSLIGVFSVSNTVNFHSLDGRGYALLSDYVLEIDTNNPQVAARLVSPLGRWKRFAPVYQAQMQEALQRISEARNLSPDVFEIVSKSLEA